MLVEACVLMEVCVCFMCACTCTCECVRMVLCVCVLKGMEMGFDCTIS